MSKKLGLVMTLLIGLTGVAHSAEMKHGDMHHKMMHGVKVGGFTEDSRVSLNLSPMMKQHQLANMRAHLDAVRKIVLSLSDNDFDSASIIASEQLGSNEKMMKMCNSFENETFKAMGMAFHKSGDELAKTLKEGDLQASLRALNTTMTSCVSCHASFRQ
ncbi:MAG: hypothetical protein A6F70_03265 [Cycloclasticus sp. symbiont of Bathymodiolus heckerae]|nr:MAG: hypothetical protein A6F70_03265 [Cycloclasticus sp. symbiont of Bathymodiolus heckerae]